MQHHINLVCASAINRTKWNQCVLNAANGLIYMQFEYLNAVTDQWDAIIVNDYETVMPIPWRRKGGIKYAYTPAFIQQLGLVGNLKDLPFLAIIKLLQSRFKYGTLLFNYNNNFIEKLDLAHRKLNLVLPLKQPIEACFLNFRSDHQKNIQQAKGNNLVYSSIISIHKTIELYKTYHAKKTPHIISCNYKRFEQYCTNHLVNEAKCFTRSVLKKDGTLLATALILKDNKRLYNILNTTTLVGRNLKANHYLFYLLINEFSEQDLILDFEGSSLTGVAEFYLGFGAKKEYYYSFHYNKLPFPLSLIR